MEQPTVFPTPQQVAWADCEIGVIIHQDLTTYLPDRYDIFAHFGDPPPVEVFAPTALDTDQWLAVAKSAGAKYAVLVAKHCTGFSLWPTDAHDYSVKNAPCSEDVVGAFIRSCQKYGLRPGIYCSLSYNLLYNVEHGAVRDGNPEKQKQYLESIRKKSLEMSELITLLFNYVKLDSEGFDLKKERINITELVLQLVAGAYTDMEEAGMIPDIDIPEEADYAEIDKMQFSRAFTNLLTNAIKHNEAGTSIKISMKKKLSYLVIKVMDSGERIDLELAQQLFDPFVMGDESRNSRGGSGLGLSVSKKVIEMHGGNLTLEQPTEEGYTKAFCIKIKQVEEKPYEYE